MILDIVIPGQPVAQGRMKFVKATGHTYDPKKSSSWKQGAAWAMIQAKGPLLSDIFIPNGPVGIIITACFQCTTTDSKVKKLANLLRWHTKKPDLDNIVKAVKDAGKGILWSDDSQVSRIVANKVTLQAGRSPFVKISVHQIVSTPEVYVGDQVATV